LRATRDRRAPSRRLATELRPRRVDLHVEVDPQRSDAFRGEVAIALTLVRRVRRIRLHAVDLRVTRPRVEVGARLLRGRIHALPGDEMIEVRLDEMLPRGEVTLRLAFAGRLRKDLCGLYGVTADRRRYAFTQLEATDARRFFPCFDEPAMKARFQISVTTAVDNEALSNAPIDRTERHGDGRKTVHFADTPPLSTYLVALAVGRLEASKRTRVGPTEIRIWHAPGKRNLTGFGLEAARECLVRLERYFGLPYPYAKLDLVAVPDFEFGAMENAGAVFFRETLLLVDPATVTLAEKKRAAEVIAHELAHMWYGDLVTMAWWDDLWLNEAFATWMAFQVVDDWKPEWKLWHDFQHARAAALELDALRHTHPIYCEVRTPADAAENFDLITYEKGASVVRMLERYLGAAAFRRGVRAYIRRHLEGNAVAADLWRSLSEASGVAVEPVARAWIERAGYPIVEVRRARVNGRTELRLRQERFTLRRPSRSRWAPPWPVPWVARIGRGRTGRGRLERRLLTRVRERVDLGPAPPRFVYGNAEEGGFFRPLHDADEMGALTGSLASLAAVERMGLVDHQWALVRARRAPIGTILDLAEALADEKDPDVLRTLQRPLGFIAHSLIPNARPGLGGRGVGSRSARGGRRAFAARGAALDRRLRGRLRAGGEGGRGPLRSLPGRSRLPRPQPGRRRRRPRSPRGRRATAPPLRVGDGPRALAPGAAALPAGAGGLPRAAARRPNAGAVAHRPGRDPGRGLPAGAAAGEPGRPRAHLGIRPQALAGSAPPHAPAAGEPSDRGDVHAARALAPARGGRLLSRAPAAERRARPSSDPGALRLVSRLPPRGSRGARGATASREGPRLVRSLRGRHDRRHVVHEAADVGVEILELDCEALRRVPDDPPVQLDRVDGLKKHEQPDVGSDLRHDLRPLQHRAGRRAGCRIRPPAGPPTSPASRPSTRCR
jgi:puromycin-sensitive aminopeptidase